jgi:hypothetical protein
VTEARISGSPGIYFQSETRERVPNAFGMVGELDLALQDKSILDQAVTVSMLWLTQLVFAS